MVRMVLAQIRARVGRALALMLGVVVATTGFSVLTGASTTSRLVVVGVVQANARAAYDVLVRPVGARSVEETDRAAVRPNHLSGQYGGITATQWRSIQRIEGVDVAAPIAMVGYAAALATVRVDLTDVVDRNLARQVIRLRPTWRADAGLTAATEEVPQFAYITRRPVAAAASGRDPVTGHDVYTLPDGTIRPLAELQRLGCSDLEVPYLYLEQQENGVWQPICGTWHLVWSGDTAALSPARFFVFQALPDGSFLDFTRVSEKLAGIGISRSVAKPVRSTSVAFRFDWPLWLPVAAIDPREEAKLVGLDRAVTAGAYLPDVTATPLGQEPAVVPVLVPAVAPVDEQLAVGIDRLASSVQVPGVGPAQLLSALTAAPGEAPTTRVYEASKIYADVLTDAAATVRLDVTLQAAPPTYTSNGGWLRPEVKPATDVWQTPISQFGERARGADALQPYLAADVGFRALSPSAVRPPRDVLNPAKVDRIGVFDPAKLTEFPGLSVLPQETYQAPQVTGADPRSRSLLADKVLRPSNNPAGYLAAPPSMLMPLDVAQRLLDRPDPVSAVRVRVGGVTGVDPVSRERVRLVAEEIATRTGLDVDVTVGSSPQPQTVHLPAGTFGRPDLALHEPWSKKGVAAAIVRAADRKSLILFCLIMVVCLLFLATALSAAVRDRHRELAVLACLGWPAWRRATLILSEVGMIGLVAGGLSAGLSGFVAPVVGIEISTRHALLAIPVALSVTLTACAVPSVRAGRAHPEQALHPRVTSTRRARRVRGIPSLAAANLARTPGRTAVGAISLAVGVAGLLFLLATVWTFNGAIVGTMLGDAVSLRARPVDAVAIATTVVLGGFAVADVLYLNVRERAAELAVLQASGWTAGALSRLIVLEATGIGFLGAILGSAAGAIGIWSLVGHLPARLLVVVAAAGATAVLSAVAAATAPALLRRRFPITTQLAED